jgi:hypothetical protein
MLMRINGCTSRIRYNSYGRGDIDFISKELTTRKMYGDKRGIDFESETVVLKSKKQARTFDRDELFSDELRRAMPNEEPKRARHAVRKAAVKTEANGRDQSTINQFSGSSSSRGCKPSGNGFFDRLIQDMETRENGGSRRVKSSGTWIKGVGDKVPEEKKACIERSLKWLEDRVETRGEPHGGAGERVDHQSICHSIRGRISNLLLHDLPAEITAELRLLAREVEQLTVAVN